MHPSSLAACTTLATLPLSEHHETAVLVNLGGLSESRIHTHRTGILLHISLHLQDLDSMSEGYELSHGVHFQERYRNCSASSSRQYNKLKWRLNHRATKAKVLWTFALAYSDCSWRYFTPLIAGFGREIQLRSRRAHHKLGLKQSSPT